MILIHRLTPFFIGLIIASGLAISSILPLLSVWVLPIVVMGVIFMFARLQKFRFRDKHFWALMATPIIFVCGSILLFVFVDAHIQRIILGVLVSVLTYLYAENLFAFIHLPAKYQAYGLQNLTGVLNVLSVFFLVSGLHALLLFVRIPLVVVATIFFPLMFGLTLTALWIAKVPKELSVLYALSGAVMATELFATLSFLPTAFTANAALVTIFFYVYLGLIRAHGLERLSKILVQRYLSIGFVTLVAVLITSRWV